MKTIKFSYCVVCLLFFSGCGLAKAISVPPGTDASFKLKSDIVRMIGIYQYAKDPGCSYKITEIKNLGIQESTVLEEWTVVACGKTIFYSIKMTPDPAGGTTFGVSRKE